MPMVELKRAEATMQAMKAQTVKRKESPDVGDRIAQTARESKPCVSAGCVHDLIAPER